MAQTFHKVVGVGYLGGDPELRQTSGGKVVAGCSIATKESWKSQSGDQQTRTTWWRASAWGRLGEVVAQFLHKGSLVYFEGTVVPSADGGPRIWGENPPKASYDLKLSKVTFLDSKSNEEVVVEVEEEEFPF